MRQQTAQRTVADPMGTPRLRVGLIGYGRAGQAVARVLADHPQIDLRWIATRQIGSPSVLIGAQTHAVWALTPAALEAQLASEAVDALVDFSSPQALTSYAPSVRAHGLSLVSAISAYSAEDLAQLQALGAHARVMASPNITLGVNFLMVAGRILRQVAPFADIEVIEQHFRHKPEVSGTAKRIAQSLDLDADRITSLRVGGIVGYHEVIFGFPHQTVRLVHESIRPEAFGTGAAYALLELQTKPWGFYSFDDLMQAQIQRALAAG